MSRDTKCCDFATLLKMKHEVLPVISHIFYTWYLQKLKSKNVGICKILHWYLFYVHNNWKNDGNFNGIFPHFLPVLYTGWIFKIIKSSKNTRRGRKLIMWIINQFSTMLISSKTCVLFVREILVFQKNKTIKGIALSLTFKSLYLCILMAQTIFS